MQTFQRESKKKKSAFICTAVTCEVPYGEECYRFIIIDVRMGGGWATVGGKGSRSVAHYMETIVHMLADGEIVSFPHSIDGDGQLLGMR